jgi:drug/metabolite transporter (DMT)-like permease
VSPRAWAAFGAVATLWGIPYLFIKIAVDDGVPPAFLAWARVVLGAVILALISWQAGLLGTLRGRWGAIAVYAVCEIVVPFPLIAAGERHVSSSLAAILIASLPLMVALLALRFDHEERVRGRRLVGLFIGLAGVVALVGIDVAGRADEMLGAAAILTAALGYAAATLVLKHNLRDLDPRATMTAALTVASLALAPFALADTPDAMPSAEAISSILVLGVFCTAAALVFFGMLIAEAGPSRATVITYVNPVIAVALGVTILGERPGVGAVAGLLLILAGSWLSTDGRIPPGLAATGAILRRRRPARGRSYLPCTQSFE